MRTTRRKERGLTLIELLAVGTIVLILTAISLPMVKPMLDSQQTRSASQVVSTYLNRAKNRAKLSGRPCGVRFEVWPGTDVQLECNNGAKKEVSPNVFLYSRGASLVMRQIDVPPEYSGFSGGETVSVNSGAFTVNNDLYLSRILEKQTQARIQFNNEGPYFRIWPNTSNLVAQPTCTLRPYENVPFKVQFSPKPTMTSPMALPQGAAIDLQFSGVAGLNQQGVFDYPTGAENATNVSDDVTIMFSPSGAVDTVNGEYPTGPIYLLIGRWDQINAVRENQDGETLPNYADGRNYWVTINPQSGLISTAEVNPVTDHGFYPTEDSTPATDCVLGNTNILQKSREFASQAKRNIGGY